MKKFKFNGMAALFSITIAILFATVLTPSFGAAGLLPSVLILGIAVTPTSVFNLRAQLPAGSAHNEVLMQMFSNQLQETLFPDNTFYAAAQFDEQIAVDCEEIYIPQDENGMASGGRDPKNFPLTIVSEEDTKKSYRPILCYTNPLHITDLNQAIVSYDKRAAKLRKHRLTLDTNIADAIAFAWSPTKADRKKQTTGSDTRDAHAKGATGTRKRVDGKDILFFMSQMNDENVPNDDRRRLVAPTYMYEDLVLLMESKKNYLESKGKIIEKGAIGWLYGYQVFMRGNVLIGTEATPPVAKDYGKPKYTGATTDNSGILLFHPDFVRYCKGNAQVYINENQGTLLGSTMNAAVRSGGTISRNDEIGVGALYEDNA